MNLERETGESLLDYHRRLIYGKLVDKTIADIDYSELSLLLYGQQYSTDVARRMIYGSRKTLDLIDSDAIERSEDDSIKSAIDDQIAELKKERQRLYDQRRELNKIISKQGRMEHLNEVIVEAAENLNETIGVLYDGNDTPLIKRLTKSGNEAVVVFGDWHYGLKANNVFNKYNTDICIQRVKNCVNKTAERLVLHNCDRLHVLVIGDLFHGAIHTSAMVASDELVCEQIMQVSEILAQSINELSRYTDEVCVYMTYGNHGRTVQKKDDSIHRDNMERLIPWWLKERLKDNPKVQVADEPDNEFVTLSVAGHDLCASHGDLDTVKSSPLLISTLMRKKSGKDVEYVILGDKHHRESFEELGITACICGSLCGSDDYANGKRRYSTPSQLLLIVNRELGVDAEYRLNCA